MKKKLLSMALSSICILTLMSGNLNVYADTIDTDVLLTAESEDTSLSENDPEDSIGSSDSDIKTDSSENSLSEDMTDWEVAESDISDDTAEDMTESEMTESEEIESEENPLEVIVSEEELNGAYSYTIPSSVKVDNRSYTRLNGSNRYYTALNIAETIKKLRGLSKFKSIIVCDGNGFADALSGSYLAYSNQAPILYTNKSTPTSYVTEYIISNIASGGTVYIMGLGINTSLDETLKARNIKVTRLGGQNRYDTNLNALSAAGLPNKQLIVASGQNFPDAMCASTTGIPIMLVNTSLTQSQIQYLAGLGGGITIRVMGGESVVGSAVYNQLSKYASSIRRISGYNRYETSFQIANEFFPSASGGELVISEGDNYVDGLAASQLSAALGVPMVLGKDQTVSRMRDFVVNRNISHVYVAERAAALSDGSLKYILCRTPSSVQIEDKGIYIISTSVSNDRVFDIPSGNYSEGIKVQIYKSLNIDSQKFQFQKQSDGSYVIMNAQTGLCLTAKAYGGSTWGATIGTSIIQYNEIESNMYKKYQKWKVYPAGNGGFYFHNDASNLNLSLNSESADIRSNLSMAAPSVSSPQIFFLTKTTASCYLRWHNYATSPSGTRYWLEGTFWDDPKVTDTQFLAAAIYTESGNQGLPGMMLTGYSMLNRSSVSELRYTIYKYGQYEICRDGALTKLLTAIANNNTSAYSQLATAIRAAQNCIAGKSLTLSQSAVKTWPGGSQTLPAGTVITKADCGWYDGFMTPAALDKHGFTTTNKHTIRYIGHVYYNTKEMWG